MVYDKPRFSAITSINSLIRNTTESRATFEMLRISTPNFTEPGITFIALGITSAIPTVPTTGGSSCIDVTSSMPRMIFEAPHNASWRKFIGVAPL